MAKIRFFYSKDEKLLNELYNDIPNNCEKGDKITKDNYGKYCFWVCLTKEDYKNIKEKYILKAINSAWYMVLAKI